MEPSKSSTTHTLPDGLYVRLKTKYAKQYEMPFTMLLEHKLYVPGSNSSSPIATSTSFVIHKDHIALADDWYEVMDSYDDEMLEFATTLFTRRAKLQSKWIVSEDRGTGVWGHELDHGSILYINNIFVGADYRGRGVGTWLLQQILASMDVTRGSCRFAYAWPTTLQPTYKTRSELIAIEESVVKMFATVGFRRVGRSNFVCYALMNTNHPSRRLFRSNDAEPIERSVIHDAPEDGLPDFRDMMFPGEYMRPEVPDRVQHALRSGRGQKLLDYIRMHHSADPTCIRVKDHQGVTPLHVAASQGRPGILSEILRLGARDDLHEKDNDGRIPLDHLDIKMANTREQAKSLFNFRGHEDLLCQSRVIIMREMGLNPPAVDMIKWGCTCGQCKGGWFSSRMFFRLKSRISCYSILATRAHI